MMPIQLITSLIGTVGWFMTQGITSIVYLTMNKSLRNAIFRKLGICRGRIGISSTAMHAQQSTMPQSSSANFSQDATKHEEDVHF
jgi:hypothetical protein